MLLSPGLHRSIARAFAVVVEIAIFGALLLLLVAGAPRPAFAQMGQGPGSGPPMQPAKPAARGAADAGAAPATKPSGDAGAHPAAEPAGDIDGGAPEANGAAASAPATQAAGPTINIPQSEAEKAEGTPITRIDISGNRRVARDDIVSYLREKPGNYFKVDNLASDVRALWDSGFFDDVEVDMTRSDHGVILRFLVRERPNIKAVEFEGNSEIENDKLQEAIEVKANTILSVPSVRRSVQKIKDAYAEKGYFLADVESAVEPQRDNEVIIKFKITEHAPVTVRRITFVGNYNVPDDELRSIMQTGQSSIFSFGSGGPYRQDIFERDVLMLNALYYDKGYMNVQVGTPRVMLTPDREGIEITLLIHEGPRFKIRQLKIYERDADGKEIEPLGGRRALRQLVRAKSGDYFNRAELVKDLQAVRTVYRDAGYANMEADPETELDPVKREVDIIVPIRRGPLVHVERIEIKGNTKTRDKVLRREMEIEEGQLFSETKLEDSKKRITALGYFERVDVSTEQGSTPETININFEVTERPTGTFQVGAGFSSIENFIATAQIQQANLFGNGQSLALQAQISGLRQLISIRFFEPYFLDSDWSTSIELYDNLLVFPDFSRRSIGGAATFGYALVQPWLRIGVTATVQHDAVDTANVNTFFGSSSGFVSVFQRLPLANLFNSGRTISLRPQITYDTRNNRLFPSSGVYLQASTEFASSALGSEIEFLRHEFTGRFYYPLFGQTDQPGSGFVLKMNNKVGLITSPLSNGVPIFARYFLGGILDVRGYRLRTLGPRLPLNSALDVNSAPIANGANIGGNLQYYSNLEFEFPIIDKVGIRGVAFVDTGNTWNLEDQFCKTTPAPQFSNLVSPCFSAKSLTYLRWSSGFGIRWFSPLGPLRFEWGFPLNKLSFEEASVFEFTIGNFF
ncbi:Outer membrane protein assembly factor YaeT precursor [Labilithrix luteola]|uniref:Outer membrane protein assembly factor BamA n=1 Tax=Labilithrix luteola TaxID=1391654 RepID=A0A0K1Q8V7_9BACT|nr:outer membrane protein assembly factor BamA [Labilithrix luteola]AKV02112.1 Outer membrane protein assembly factor YaeT precursor [Labilithrix luteola]